jgi:hypothetical protein
MLAPTDTVFTVTVDGGEVTLTSRPLQADRLVVTLRWADSTSSWTFSYLGDPRERERWQAISGSVAINGGREQLDDREQFARAVAARAGWGQSVQQRSEVEGAAARPSESSDEDEPRWRARTDVWGRPLDVRRR